jgi:hypothetical protein
MPINHFQSFIPTKPRVTFVKRAAKGAQKQAARVSFRASVAVSPSSAPIPTPPQIQNILPTPGTGINPTTPISFDVVLAAGDTLRLIMVIASFPGLLIEEVIYDGVKFGPQYQGPNNSLTTPIATTMHFQVLRQNGWPASPTLTPYAIDVVGEENP